VEVEESLVQLLGESTISKVGEFGCAWLDSEVERRAEGLGGSHHVLHLHTGQVLQVVLHHRKILHYEIGFGLVGLINFTSWGRRVRELGLCLMASRKDETSAGVYLAEPTEDKSAAILRMVRSMSLRLQPLTSDHRGLPASREHSSGLLSLTVVSAAKFPPVGMTGVGSCTCIGLLGNSGLESQSGPTPRTQRG
jgi:hypothetical protein